MGCPQRVSGKSLNRLSGQCFNRVSIRTVFQASFLDSLSIECPCLHHIVSYPYTSEIPGGGIEQLLALAEQGVFEMGVFDYTEL